MSDTLSALLETIVTPDMPRLLISVEHMTHISQTIHLLPSQLTEFFGFECRLGDPAPQADFLLCVDPMKRGRKVLAGGNRGASLPAEFLVHPVWQRLHTLGCRWADPNSTVYQDIDNIWLEFDVDGAPAAIPVPSVFFGLTPVIARSPNDRVRQILQSLRGKDIPPDIACRLSHCWSALPQEAQVFQVGTMLARDSDAVRLCARGLAPEDMPSYLCDVGWSGQRTALDTLIAALIPLVDNMCLDFDVGKDVLPKIGLECYIEPGQHATARWEQLLDYFVQIEQCLPDKRNAILAYQGCIHEGLQPEGWPFHLKSTSAFLKPNDLSAFVKKPHHVKVVYQPNEVLEVKAYLAAFHIWL